MAFASARPFQCTSAHEAVAAIIRRHSTNQNDIRDVAMRGLDLSAARDVLELGCGCGFMSGTLAGRVAADATVVGVDLWPSNEPPFRRRVTGAGRQADFINMDVDSELPWQDDSFDVVMCCYSMYFFPQILPETVRVLRSDGVLLIVTHSERNIEGQLPAAGFGDAASELVGLIRQFSAENGHERLGGLFRRVTRIDFRNSLRFGPADRDELFLYLRFKLPLLVPGAALGDDLPRELTLFVDGYLAGGGRVVIDKNDAVFQCQEPKCR